MSPPNQPSPSKATGGRRAADVVERLGDVVRRPRVDIADEAQRDVIVGGLEPARADHAAARQRDLADDGLRQLQSGEQTRHRGFRM